MKILCIRSFGYTAGLLKSLNLSRYSRCKKASIFRGFIPWILAKGPPWTLGGDCNTSRPPPTFYNIQKLNHCAKTDISKTASVRSCYQAYVVVIKLCTYQKPIRPHKTSSSIAFLVTKLWARILIFLLSALHNRCDNYSNLNRQQQK